MGWIVWAAAGLVRAGNNNPATKVNGVILNADEHLDRCLRREIGEGNINSCEFLSANGRVCDWFKNLSHSLRISMFRTVSNRVPCPLERTPCDFNPEPPNFGSLWPLL